MDEQLKRIEAKLIEIEGKLDATHRSAEKTRKIMLWTGIISIAFIIIPLFFLPFLAPAFLSSQGVGLGAGQGLGL